MITYHEPVNRRHTKEKLQRLQKQILFRRFLWSIFKCYDWTLDKIEAIKRFIKFA